MTFKRLIGFLLTICLIMGLLPISAVQAFAATEIKSIALTGDITPVAGQAMRLATAPSNTNYTVVQGWVNVDDGKGFTDSEEYNNMLEEDFLLSEAERKFEEGKTYQFSVLVTLQSANVKFAPNMTVSVTPYGNMPLLKDVGNGMAVYQLDFNIGIAGHIHVRESQYRYNDSSHWYRCTQDDGFVFDDTEEPHDMDVTTGVCKACGYVATEADATKIVSQPQTSITVDCGDAIELTVGATGRNLHYDWKKKGSQSVFSDGENYNHTGLKISGSHEATLKIENCNHNLERYLPLVCHVTGMWGDDETEEVNVEINHRSEVYVSTDGSGHTVQCDCGKVIQASEAHNYNSNNICEKCGYEKGTARTQFQQATLELPDFSDKNTAAEAIRSATLSGIGIKEGTGIKELVFTYSDNVISDNTMLEKEKGYGVRIYPDLEDNFYMGGERFLTRITYKGVVKRSYTHVDEDGRCYLKISLGKPYVRKVARFSSNGGAGSQNDVYADEQGNIYFPEHRFYKSNDEFYAWEYNGKLYAEDPNEFEPVHLEEVEYATVKAIWKKQLINRISVLMDTIEHGKKISEIKFSVPQSLSSEYSLAGVTWYEDNYHEITKDELGLMLGDDETLDKKKNYNVKVTLKGIGNGFADDLALWLNLRNIEEFKKTGLEYLTFVLHIKGDDADITLTEPIEGMKLDQADDMKITSSILYIDPTYTYWIPDEDSDRTGQYDPDHIVSRENPYYLNLMLNYKEDAKNTIVFGRTVSINGKEYRISSSWHETERIRMPFAVRNLYVTVSENTNGIINIESPKDMNVTFAMALYDSSMKLKELIWEKELALTKGSNEINFLTFDFSKGASMIYRNSGDSVKVMVFEEADTLKTLSSAYYYKYRQSKY